MRHPARAMNSLLAAVEVATTHEPHDPDRPHQAQNMATAPAPATPGAASAAASASATPPGPAPPGPARPISKPRSRVHPNRGDEPRKGARVFTADQRKVLEKEYKKDKFPTRQMMTEFATKLNKPIEKVRTWFNNRRALDRKMGKDVARIASTKPPFVSAAASAAVPQAAATPGNPGPPGVQGVIGVQVQVSQAQAHGSLHAHLQQQHQQQSQHLSVQGCRTPLVRTQSTNSNSPSTPPPPMPPPLPTHNQQTKQSNTSTTSSALEQLGHVTPVKALKREPTLEHLGAGGGGASHKLHSGKQPVGAIALTPETPRVTMPLAIGPVGVSTGVLTQSQATNTTPISATRRISMVTPGTIGSMGTPTTSVGASASASGGTGGSASGGRMRTPVRNAPRRLAPVRFRNARLRLGDTELNGEGHVDDVGLEVKFLFGKRRLVYEWYSGDNFADAPKTGGPYAKIEINFDSVFCMNFVRTRDGSRIEMTLSDKPALYKQAQDNLHKFRNRSQQRQYQKAARCDFKVDVEAKEHCIHLRSDEAARVKKTIMESVPELAALVTGVTPTPHHPHHHLALAQMHAHSHSYSHSFDGSAPHLTDSESANAPGNGGGASASHRTNLPDPLTPAAHAQARDVIHTPAAATPAPWHHLPATPLSTDLRAAPGSALWLETGVITPMSEQRSTAPLSGPLVRRALDFTPSVKQRKRRLPIDTDENDAASGNKKAKEAKDVNSAKVFKKRKVTSPLMECQTAPNTTITSVSAAGAGAAAGGTTPPPPPPPLPVPISRTTSGAGSCNSGTATAITTSAQLQQLQQNQTQPHPHTQHTYGRNCTVPPPMPPPLPPMPPTLPGDKEQTDKSLL